MTDVTAPPDPDVRILALARLQSGVLTVAQLRALGLGADAVRTRVRRGQYRRLWRGVIWTEAELHPEPPWRTRATGALLLHGPAAKLGLQSAATALVIAGADARNDDIHVVLPRGNERHQVEGIRLHTWPVPPERTSVVDGLRTTDVVQTLADLVPRLPRHQAVSVLDSALNRGLVSDDDLVLAEGLAAGRPGCEVARPWWQLADARSQSVLETWTRLDCIDGGVPPDELQHPVRDRSGVLLGYGDLAWLRDQARPLIGEADGAAVHGAVPALYSDRLRANNFTAAGVRIIRFTWRDARRPGACAAMVRAALVNR